MESLVLRGRNNGQPCVARVQARGRDSLAYNIQNAMMDGLSTILVTANDQQSYLSFLTTILGGLRSGFDVDRPFNDLNIVVACHFSFSFLGS